MWHILNLSGLLLSYVYKNYTFCPKFGSLSLARNAIKFNG